MKKTFLILMMVVLYVTSSFALWTDCVIQGSGGVSSISVTFYALEDCRADEYIATYHYEDGTVDVQTSHMGTINFGTWDCCPYY